ncbi:hypothetical protein Syn7502_03548 [Synechococcus sp. PCC 7502]|uniref:family 10 glycosylhydrolase n=1 Tax=Synechococcus sp. PCC 7502 TaxID=1173263 RepID=UPI00029FD77B|nr:family 10 glycosylhydrolase [Synechococcus sp. PCC 7502]AFY75385.1 hypothetical protein Syn7502_03548 [Synechococcus sp. PCC 7502]
MSLTSVSRNFQLKANLFSLVPSLNQRKSANYLVKVCLWFWCASITSAQALPVGSISVSSCNVDVNESILKNNLRKTNDPSYLSLVAKHKNQLAVCRSQDAIKSQALVLRLYPKDAKSEVLTDVLDRVVNRGYNAIFVEVFYDGQILLPVASNPTPWQSVTKDAVKAGTVTADYDLWAEVIRQGHERGLKVYGWAIAMNYGYSYSQFSERAPGKTLSNPLEPEHILVDPFNAQAKSNFAGAIANLIKRQPDGILFDYFQYSNSKKLINNVKDLWIYGEESRQSLLGAMPDAGTKQLMASYLETGKITPEMIKLLQVTQQNTSGIVQTLSSSPVLVSQLVEQMLWQLAVNHAYQGVLGFINGAIASINSTNSQINIGAVFAPSREIYNARVKTWERFPAAITRYPMIFNQCDSKCIANEVLKIINALPVNTKVCPVLMGTWGQPWQGHPSLESQMQAIRSVAPQISCISHWDYAALEPDSDRERQTGL